MKGTAMAAAIAAARNAPASTSSALSRLGGVSWDKAPCRFCGTGCHVMVGTAEGKVVAVAGDADADVNRGLLCAKGYHVGEIMYGDDRLTTPLLRKHGELVPISWDEALDVIADRVEADPGGFAMYGSGQWTIAEGYVANKFSKGGLANNHIDPNARLCMASAVTGFLATYGVDEPASCYDDLEACDVAIMWGNNMAEAHPVLFSRLVDRKLRGGHVSIIDLATRRTRTSDMADRYLPFRPHTDLAVANGIAHLLLEQGAFDQEFVQKHCNFRRDTDPMSLFGEAMTFDEYRTALAPYTPEEVERISGVHADDIRWLASLFADPEKRIASFWCMGMNQHTRGTAINTLVHGVHLLSGHFGRPGDGPTSLTGQPSACGTVREVGTLAHTLPGGRLVFKQPHREWVEKQWNLPAGRIHDKPGHHTIKMWDAFTTPKDEGGDISTIWVQVTNPAQSLPNSQKLFFDKESAGDKFLIVSDVYPTVTTEQADLVLPSALWVEKNGMFGNSERRTQQWFRQVLPPGDARDDCWQIIALAKRLFDRGMPGMQDKHGRFLFELHDESGAEIPAWDWARYYDHNVDQALFEEYRPFTRMKHKDLAPYETYVNSRGLRWPVVQGDDGRWRETRWRFAEGLDPYVSEGKGVQFYHSVTKDDRAQVWFRPYERPPEMPDSEYPFWLCTGRVLEQWHTASMTGRVDALRDAMPVAFVEMHPKDADVLGVRNGDRVELTSRRGRLVLPAWVGGRGQPERGNVFVPFFDESKLINRLTLDETCPISKQPDYKKCAVALRKVEA
ncbi:MAG: nitrate reductase [Planctomycetota bacterium]|nr:MAG: nitrate reductase [Planctomycetota bacterium]